MPYQKSKGLAVNATQRISVIPEPPKKSTSRKSVNADEYNELKASVDEKDATIRKLAEEKQAILQRVKTLESAVLASKTTGSGTDTKEMEEALRLCRIQMAEEEKISAMKSKKTAAAKGMSSTAHRPKSAPAVSSRGTKTPLAPKKCLSSAEEAHIDNYVQKQLMIRMKEKNEILEQKQYELELRERTIRASKGSKTSADEMLARQQAALQKSRDKFLTMKEELEREEKEKAEERKRKRRETLSKPIPGLAGPSWKEMQEEAEKRRKERVEKRIADQAQLLTPKVELESRKAEADAKLKALEEKASHKYKPFKATDPEKVTMRLAKQQKAWETALNEAKARTRMKSLALSVPDPVVVSMEKRTEQYEQKRKDRLAKKKALEEETQKKREAVIQKRQAKLLSTRRPDSRPCKIVEKRAALVRKSMQDLEEEKEKEIQLRAKREKKLALAGVLVNNIVKEFDQQRKSKPGYVGARTEKEWKEYNEQSKEEFRRKYQENRKRVLNAVKSMPTLIERHDQAILAAEAAKKEEAERAAKASNLAAKKKRSELNTSKSSKSSKSSKGSSDPFFAELNGLDDKYEKRGKSPDPLDDYSEDDFEK